MRLTQSLSPPRMSGIAAYSPFFVLTPAYTLRTVSACASVRHDADGAPEQTSSFGSHVHARGSVRTPSATPSFMSHAARTAF